MTSWKNSGHRNTFRKNRVIDNGNRREGYGFYVAPHAGDIVIEDNQIAETRATGGAQRIGVFKTDGAGAVRMTNNRMSGHSAGDYREGAAARARKAVD